MFNKQKIKDLLEERNIRHKDLLEYLGKNHNGSLNQLLEGDMKASNLEKIANFFCVPIDYFFDRDLPNNGVVVNGKGNMVHHFSVNPALQEIKNLEALIDEKDKRIKILEEHIDLLKKHNSV